MKVSVVSALLFGSLATAFVVPAQLEKRQDTTDEVIVTVTSTTTIYLDPTAAAAFFESQSAASLSAAEATLSSTTSTPSSTTTATSTPSPPPTTTPQAAPAPTPAVQAEEPTTTPVSVYTPPATSAAPAPAYTSTAAAPAASGGEVSGDGDITYYELSAGLTSCGGSYSDSQAVVALPISIMEQYDGANPNDNPLCGKTVTITYNGATYTGEVVDSCGGCDSQSIDLSPSLFQTITGNLGLGRVSGVQWSVA